MSSKPRGGGKGHTRESSGNFNPSGQKVQNVKLVLLGDQGVGKSSLALRFVRGEFQENCEATIGAAFLTQTVNVASTTIKFDIWDTAGQERYHSLAPMYYRGAQAAIVVYDVTNAKTFSKATAWIRELRQQANSQIIMVLAGNKADMASEKRTVSRDEAQAFAEENNLIFGETSAKTGMCVGEIFMDVAESLARNGLRPESEDSAGLKLEKKKTEKKRECC